MNAELIGHILMGGAHGLSQLSVLKQRQREEEERARRQYEAEARQTGREEDLFRREEERYRRRFTAQQDIQHRRDVIDTELDERERAEAKEQAALMGDREIRERQESIEVGQHAARVKAGTFDARYNRWLRGGYTPGTQAEVSAFRKKAGVTGAAGPEEAQVPVMQLFSTWAKMDLDERKQNGETFDAYVQQYVDAERKWGRAPAAGDRLEFRGSPTAGLPTPGTQLPQGGQLPQQYPQTGNQGIDVYNQMATGQIHFTDDKITFDEDVMRSGRIADPTDTMPAGPAPLNSRGQPVGSDQDAVDLTPDLDPGYYTDPERCPDAARAYELMTFYEQKGWMRPQDQEWLDQYLESVGL